MTALISRAHCRQALGVGLSGMSLRMRTGTVRLFDTLPRMLHRSSRDFAGRYVRRAGGGKSHIHLAHRVRNARIFSAE
jgi:hypothetical protein